MKRILSLVLLLISFSTFAGGAGAQFTDCYTHQAKSFTFPGDIRSYELNQTVSVSVLNGKTYKEVEMTLSNRDERTFEFTSEDLKIVIHQKEWFLYDVSVDSIIKGQSQTDTMVCNVN